MLSFLRREKPLARLADRQIRPLAAHLAASERGATIAICAGSQGEGASTVIVNLARALESPGGRRVLIADWNVDRPRLHSHYGLPQGPGATDVLTDGVRLRDALYVAASGTLAVLPAGTKTRKSIDKARLFGPAGLSSLLLPLRNVGFDIVLIDLPSILLWPEAVNIASRCTQSAIVVKASGTSRKDACTMRDRLMDAGSNVAGVILNTHD